MSKKYPLQKTGNIAVDTVCACLHHNKRYGRRIKYINLSIFYWMHFTEWFKKNVPDVNIDADGVMFNKTVIRKGHRFMVENIEVEFYPQEIIKA
jgi:hypothetical protein